MTFTPEETTKLKAMMLYLVKKKHSESDGNCGFSLVDLVSILEELETEGIIKSRPTIGQNRYFLTT